MNVFEGARRITYVTMGIISVVGIMTIWGDRNRPDFIEVSYMNAVSLVMWDENSYNSDHLITKTRNGVEVHLVRHNIPFDKAINDIKKDLHFATKFDISSAELVTGFEDVYLSNGAILTNVSVHKNKSAKEVALMVFKNIGCDPDLINSLSKEDLKFKIPKKDEETIEKEYNKRKIGILLIDFLSYGGGVLGIWIFSFITGCIVRGFAVIPMKNDNISERAVGK